MTPKPDNLPAPADMDLPTLLRECARVLHNAGGADRGAGYSAQLAEAALHEANMVELVMLGAELEWAKDAP
jgi:hypothetical protein